jgi:hypothetical protein
MSRLRWTRGRTEDEAPGDDARALEWIGRDAAGQPIARVVRLRGPLWHGWRLWHAVALDEDGRVVELRQSAPEDGDWLAYVGGRVVGRAPLPLKAVRAAEAALAG